MKTIGIITKREKAHRAGSIMEQAVELLTARGIRVVNLYPEEMVCEISRIANDCELYLLKSGTEMALSLAGVLDLKGARILNPYRTVVEMRDKILATQRLQEADVPLPETWFVRQATQLADLLDGGPLVVKPFWAASQGRGVQVVRRPEELAGIESDEGLIFSQRFHQPDGRDHKIYVVGDQVFGVRRVWPPKTLEDKLGEPFEVPAEMREIALRCGRAFGVALYGVDIVISDGRPYVIDINNFPGYKGVPDAPNLLAEFIVHF